MTRALALAALVACSLPSEADVERAVDDATEECRSIARAEFALVALPLLEAIKDECRSLGDRSVDTILLYVGCAAPDAGGVWDCSGARARACAGMP